MSGRFAGEVLVSTLFFDSVGQAGYYAMFALAAVNSWRGRSREPVQAPPAGVPIRLRQAARRRG